MLDFVKISTKKTKEATEVYPKFVVSTRSKDLMIRGGDFYAVWDEEIGLWSTDEDSVSRQVDKAIDETKAYLIGHNPDERFIGRYMWDGDSGSIDRWHKYVQKQMRDHFEPLDEKIIFSNTDVKQTDFASKRLSYPLKEGPIDAYNELMDTLYDISERDKLEWAIGAIISGDAKHIQKFEVLYGSAGTGKSTVLNIIERLFHGYTSTFNAKELSSANNVFALESFKSNPLVSIQHDGDLSRIEDNTKLNSIVSHEMMEVNAKYTKLYNARFKTFLFMGTNKPVKITEAKSGIIRRLIDVKPSGRKLPYKRYSTLMKRIEFELGGIAYHCLQRYEEMGENYYDNYIPVDMISATNDFYDFVDHYLEEFIAKDVVTLNEVWQSYKEYCEFAHAFQLPLRVVRTEMQNYFKEFAERDTIDGRRVRNVYKHFRADRFERGVVNEQTEEDIDEDWLEFKEQESIFDVRFYSWQAQYAKSDGSPRKAWVNVTTILSDIHTQNLHWVKPPAGSNFICADFDLRGPDGKKDFELNRRAAAKWPKTYAEVSNSGNGIHLYYIYDGDVGTLSRVFDDNIEIKVFTGNSSLRRRLSLCNNVPVAVISSGLPLKGDKKVISTEGIKSERTLRTLIKRGLNKEIHPDTTSSVDFIKYILDIAHDSGMAYDVTDLEHDILIFAMNSSHQSERCVRTVGEMHFKSDKPGEPDISAENSDNRLVFIDVEVYSNLFGIVWKYENAEQCVRMVNPKPYEVEDLFKLKLVGFNCRQYDNHILWAAACGYSTQKLYELSQRIINEKKGFFGEAYNLSYTDVLDFSTEKMSLKKWEIKLGIHHQEMGIPWDQPVPEDMIDTVMEYCENDVRATEAVFHARYGDFTARKIQVDLVKLLYGDEIKVSVNDTTNTLSKRIIFGKNTEPQSEFNYRDLSKPVPPERYEEYREKFGPDYRFRVFDSEGIPLYRDFVPGEKLPDGYSILPFFKGYTFENGVSMYLGEKIGEGGRNYSARGLWLNVWDGDVSSQHPHSIIAEVLFGPKYTKIFEDIVKGRVAIKHKDFDAAGNMLNGALKPYLSEEGASDLAQALKIVVNSIYGLTKAGFKNEFRDIRNVDNIVAKRGALFMTLLKREVEASGYKVCHIKTDSIKIPNADQKIKDFVIKFGREFGYEFETEAEFTKFCLLNDSAYVGRTVGGEWITKADQFKAEKQPYLFKTLFSHKHYEFSDFCETMAVAKGVIYLDLNEELGEPVDDLYAKECKKLERLTSKDGVSEDKINEQIDICDRLKEEIPKHHNYVFVGRVGLFTPVVEGAGGGYLYRYDNGKYYAIGGTKGYRWLESENVKKYGKQDKIDKSYYTKIVDQAVADISEVSKEAGYDFEWFISDAGVPDDFMNIPEDAPEELPWD